MRANNFLFKMVVLLVAMGFATASFALPNLRWQNQVRKGASNFQRARAIQHLNGIQNGRQCVPFNTLTKSQQTTATKILKSYRQNARKNIKKLRATNLMLRKALQKKKINEAKINQLVQAINQLRGQIFTDHIQAHLKMVREVGIRQPICNGQQKKR